MLFVVQGEYLVHRSFCWQGKAKWLFKVIVMTVLGMRVHDFMRISSVMEIVPVGAV